MPIPFFKIILKTNLERLKIPNLFTRRYGSGLSNPVFFNPPDGTEWKVYWTKKNNGEFWFEKGWKEFAQNYSLDLGYLVVFKYEGTSQFDVFIVDQRALEIDYPIPSSDTRVEKDNLDHSDDESVKILKARPKSTLFSPRPHKKMRKGTHTNVEISSNFQNLLVGNHSDQGTKLQTSVKHQLNGLKTILPIRFFKIIFQTNLERLKIPNMFTRRYGSGLSNPVFFKPPDGTEWKVYWTKKNGEFWFEKGWKEFAENYSLELGHLVVFTYEGNSQIDVLIVDQTDIEIDHPDEMEKLDQSDDESVEILDEWRDHKARQKPLIPLFSAGPHKKMRGQNATQRSLSLNWPREPRAQKVATNFISESDNPFFTKYIKPVLERRMSIPNMDGYIENKNNDVILQVGKRSWHMKLLGAQNSSCRRFNVGWSLFATENELQPGDVCVFELINKEDIVFKVHVFKSHD